ncbi:MAG TPA: nicotinate phosphoribosyltransferase [Steroidobacteraceae bacterium]|nr:nicotinate phosphoribosyltransferase [Steroidobacteraceae bacterium]
MNAPAIASPLLTDLYQLTMVTAYFELGFEQEAVFEFFVRELPPERGFLLAAGLQQVIEYLESLRFTPDDLDWLAATGRFKPAALERLGRLHFTGAVDAMPEGTAFFADEPILRVSAPLPEAQFVESRIINLLHFQTLIASKAARCRLAAGPRRLADFGMRRAHGAEAALFAARACYIAGFDSTATVAAGRAFDIELSGTMAHSFIQAHHDEAAAFADFARVHPRDVTLLLDTYDTRTAAARAVELVRAGTPVAAVRLDSGDLAALAREVRDILDRGGAGNVRIVASGNLDEHGIAALLEAGAPIDAFGVGTRLDASVDAPTLDCVYKLQEYAGQPRRKRSPGKATWPGRKQVWRNYGGDGRITRDVLGLVEEVRPGAALLQPVLRSGARVVELPGLAAIRRHAARELETLPAACRNLRAPAPLVAQVSPVLRALADSVDREFR